MDRRSFFKGALAAGVVAPVINSAQAGTPDPVRHDRRVSCLMGDPGERLYAELCGDGKKITVYLDGIEQKYAVTADEVEGMVYRPIMTPEGNLAINRATGDIPHETVYGRVQIVVNS